jgi:hypothetical protein
MLFINQSCFFGSGIKNHFNRCRFIFNASAFLFNILSGLMCHPANAVLHYQPFSNPQTAQPSKELIFKSSNQSHPTKNLTFTPDVSAAAISYQF